MRKWITFKTAFILGACVLIVSITIPVSLEIKRRSDWQEFRKSANARWSKGIKVEGDRAKSFLVDLVPIPIESSFTIWQDINRGKTNFQASAGPMFISYQQDFILVHVQSSAPDGLGFSLADRDGTPLSITAKDGGLIFDYFSIGWSKAEGVKQIQSHLGTVTLTFQGRKYVVKATPNIGLSPDAEFWKAQGAPPRPLLEPMTLEIYGLEPTEVFPDSNPPAWFKPVTDQNPTDHPHQSGNLAEDFKKRLQSNPICGFFIKIGVVVTGIAGFCEGVKKLFEFIRWSQKRRSKAKANSKTDQGPDPKDKVSPPPKPVGPSAETEPPSSKADQEPDKSLK